MLAPNQFPPAGDPVKVTGLGKSHIVVSTGVVTMGNPLTVIKTESALTHVFESVYVYVIL